MQVLNIKDLQMNYDIIMDRVEKGESFIVEDGVKSVLLTPYESIIDDELIRVHTEHNDAS